MTSMNAAAAAKLELPGHERAARRLQAFGQTLKCARFVETGSVCRVGASDEQTQRRIARQPLGLAIAGRPIRHGSTSEAASASRKT
jgi:hypothetical protein